MKNNLLIKISFIIIFLISVFLIISGLTENEDSIIDSTIYEEGINLSSSSVDLEVNESIMINASVIPPNATYKNLTWTSINPSIATVSNGNITAISEGTCIIKVETEKKKITRVIAVNVHSKVIPVEKIIIENNNIELYVGDTSKINYSILPENATNKNLSFKSENPNVAAFDENNEIVGVEEGNTTIVVSSNNGIKESINVTVKKKTIDVTKVTFDKQGLVLKVNESDKVNVVVSPSNATDKTITWESSNTNVASVDNGVIKAINYGDSIITAKSNNGIEAKMTVVVPKEHNPQNLAVTEYLNDSSRNIKTHFKNFNCKRTNCDSPRLYTSKITGNIKVSLYNPTSNKKDYIDTVGDNISLSNLMIPGNIYYLESANDNKNNEYVRLSKGVRMIEGSIKNIRDIGGWKTDSGTLKYGLIFRGETPYGSVKNTESVFKLIGITDIIDIRSNKEFNAVKNKLTAFSKHNYPVTGYTISDKNNRLAVESIMKLVVSGKRVFFHCAVGTDRTGTIALLLEGILGVNQTNLFDDYELSYFRREVSNMGHLRTYGNVVKLYNSLNSYGSSIPEKFINWFLKGSSDKNKDLKLINDFIKKMIEGNPSTYKLSNGNLIKE